jgi:hypothetical protein
MTLDTSGNLGLGVTPSAWGGSFKAFQITSGGTSLWSDGSVAFYNRNTFYDGTNRKYVVNGFAQEYAQLNDGSHAWKITTSGSANGNITFTQAMTLDASGNFYVGTTSQSGGSNITFNQPANADMKVAATASTGTRASYQVFINTTVSTFGTENSTGGSLASGTAAYATVIANNGAYPISFSTNNTERARITSGGDLLVGTTDSGSGATAAKQRIIGAAANNLYLGSTSAGGWRITSDALNDGGTFYHIKFTENGTERGSITSNGTITTYNTTSDYRLKTVIGPVANAGQRIDALQPVEYTWNADGSRTRGFLAHQFQEVYASSVSGTKDAVDAEGKPVYQAMQASTSEVIADLVAEIQSLRARVAALESQA